MKLILTIVPLVAFASAFVLPDEQITQQLILQNQESAPVLENVQHSAGDVWSSVEAAFRDTAAFADMAFDRAIYAASDSANKAKAFMESHLNMEKWDVQGWFDSPVDDIQLYGFDTEGPNDMRHHGHHGVSNKTVYELIAGSKYTTTLAKLIDEYPDLVETLNSTTANYTIFAPTDKAFKKIPKHGKKPSKELIKKVLAYHISPELYTTHRILASHTIPTALKEAALGGDAQRLRVSLSLRGLSINFYSRVVASNLFAKNGVIHAVDSVILPPPAAIEIIKLFPSQFSTFELGLTKTGLSGVIAQAYHEGGTLFAPSNFAFRKLGPKINAFLFSKHGEKYLLALLKYHVVANQTLYSDAFYRAKGADGDTGGDADADDIPKGRFHVDLPTLLDDKSLSIDVARYGGFISININAYNKVAIQDGISKDGVIHTVNSVLIPPKTPNGAQYIGEELSLTEFKARFDTYVAEL